MDDAPRQPDQFTILATEGRKDDRTRVLKQGETFAIFDRVGDVPFHTAGEFGLYHAGTRHLSRYELRIGGEPPMLLSSTIRKARPVLTADLTTPDLSSRDGDLVLPKGVLHLLRTTFLWNQACHERMQISNYGQGRLHTTVALLVDADFADIFEVRGMIREQRGRRLDDRAADGRLVLSYVGLDSVLRRTTVSSVPPPTFISAGTLTYVVDVAPGETMTVELSTACDVGDVDGQPTTYVRGLDLATSAQVVLRSRQCQISSANEDFNEWLSRSASDLTMMTTERPEGLYPYAGVPWFSAPFGRDGIVAALEFLWIDPTLAKGVLSYLASTQAAERDVARDAEPGKILHEAREGEMANLREVPFARYYGSADATPLFVMLAGAYYDRTGDTAFVEAMWPHVERALKWLDDYGDVDGDGFIEYARRSPNGLVNQGWKDSSDAISHHDGGLPDGPIALCEVQAYAYGARRAAARLASATHRLARSAELHQQADAMRERFERRFWMPDLDMYALALDGRKQPCRVRASNAGHCLFTGIASEARARRLADVLFCDAMYSGWGVRTLAAGEVRHNPMSYHNGSVWPHDNAIIAMGLARYGLKAPALKILSDLFDATSYLDLRRMPELFCGFSRRPGEGPTLYPIACLPQAWSAGVVFMLLQAALGLEIDGVRRQVTFTDPMLPDWLRWLRIENLSVAGGVVDLLCERHPHDVGISVLRRDGDIRVVHVT